MTSQLHGHTGLTIIIIIVVVVVVIIITSIIITIIIIITVIFISLIIILIVMVVYYRVDHNIKGQGIYAYVVLAEGTKATPELKKKLNDVVRNQIGSFAVPDTIHWAPGRPSGVGFAMMMTMIITKEINKQTIVIIITITTRLYALWLFWSITLDRYLLHIPI